MSKDVKKASARGLTSLDGPGILQICLMNAIMSGDQKGFDDTLQNVFFYPNPLNKPIIDWSLLKTAVLRGHLDMARTLVLWGAKPTGDDLRLLRFELYAPGAFDQALGVLRRAGVHGLDQIRTIDVTAKFAESQADYRNCFGLYVITAGGKISQPKILYTDLSKAALSETRSARLHLFPNEVLGAFILSDGIRKNPEHVLLSSEFNFSATRPPRFWAYLPQDNVEIKGDCFHVDAQLNADGCDHVKTLHLPDGSVRLGFEDMWNNGDHSFTDVVMELSAVSAPFQGTGKSVQKVDMRKTFKL